MGPDEIDYRVDDDCTERSPSLGSPVRVVGDETSSFRQYLTVLIICLMNLINFMDRWVTIYFAPTKWMQCLHFFLIDVDCVMTVMPHRVSSLPSWMSSSSQTSKGDYCSQPSSSAMWYVVKPEVNLMQVGRTQETQRNTTNLALLCESRRKFSKKIDCDVRWRRRWWDTWAIGTRANSSWRSVCRHGPCWR